MEVRVSEHYKSCPIMLHTWDTDFMLSVPEAEQLIKDLIRAVNAVKKLQL